MDRITETGHAWVAGGKQSLWKYHNSFAYSAHELPYKTWRFLLNDGNRNSLNQNRRKQTDLAVRLIYWLRNFHEIWCRTPELALTVFARCEPFTISSNIPSIRWYKAPNNVNLEGGRPGKGRRFGLEAFFFRANALPLWHHFWPKENKFPIPLTKSRGQMCFIESSNIPTFGENLICFKMLSVYKQAHQFCQLTFIGV